MSSRAAAPLGALRPSQEEFATEWARIPDGPRETAARWIEALEAMPQWGCASVSSAMERLALELQTSQATARRMYDYARRGRDLGGRLVHGWKALVDWRRVSDVGEVVPAETVTWWRQIYERYKGRANCGRRAHHDVVQVLKLKLHPIPGYERVGGFPPAGPRGLPEGWSYRNFMRAMPNQFVKVVNRQGRSAGAAFRPLVVTTRVGLEVGQVYMFDDVWHDFEVKPTVTAKAQRLLELCCLDLFSAKRVCYGLKPEIEDSEGVRRRIAERDMRFLLAATLSLHGYRRDGTVLVSEHGTAVIREDIRAVLYDATGGKITCADSAIEDRPALLGWYAPRGRGNFRIKAALESSFNLVHNATAMLPGQIGSMERVNAPDEIHGRRKVDQALVKAISGMDLSPERLDMLHWPFWPYWQAADLLDDVYAWLDARTDHHLEGWEKAGLVTGEVRLSKESHVWHPTYLLAQGTDEERAALEALMRVPAMFRHRRLSPAEVWHRDAQALQKLPMSVLPMILGRDLGEERKVNDRGQFSFQDSTLDPEAVSYTAIAENEHGDQIMLQDGERYLTFVNPFDLRWMLVCDARGRWIGRCARVQPVCRTDTKALHEAMGRVARVESLRLREWRGRHQGEAAQRQADERHNALVLAGAPVTRSEKQEAAARAQFAPVDLVGEEDGEALPAAAPAGAGDFSSEVLL